MDEWWDKALFRKCLLDSGTAPDEVERIGHEIKEGLSVKLPIAIEAADFNNT